MAKRSVGKIKPKWLFVGDSTGTVERSLIIITGAGATVIVGFLGQIWSAAPLLRASIGEELYWVGIIFTMSFMPVGTRLARDEFLARGWPVSETIFHWIWTLFAGFTLLFFVYELSRIRSTVAYYAACSCS